MAHRTPTKSGLDKKIFTQSARRIKKINVNPKLSRGGIRL